MERRWADLSRKAAPFIRVAIAGMDTAKTRGSKARGSRLIKQIYL